MMPKMTPRLTFSMRNGWAVTIGLLYLGVAAAGAWAVAYSLSQPEMRAPAAAFLGGIPLVVGGLLGLLHLSIPLWPRTPRSWMAQAVLLGISTIGTCPPLAIPVFVGWLSSEVKLAHGRKA